MSLLLRDRRVQFALGISLLEWLFVAGAAVFGSSGQFPAVMLVITIASILQFWALFYRTRRTPFAKAQQLFREGRFEETINELQNQIRENPADVQALTLLGNTYRQIGELANSETALRKAVQQKPDSAFPLYGLGRTLLVQGNFIDSAHWIENALEHGGRKILRADLALAYYLNGNLEKAGQVAEKAARTLQMEAYRVLMVNYILHQTQNDSKAIPIMKRMADALPYWHAEAERYATTPYGSRLKQEIVQLESLLSKE